MAIFQNPLPPSWFNVLNYGAVGNGSSNPASTRYGSLGALQAIYGTTISGVTVALTQELDWLATQAAINAAAVNGGTVYSPGGYTYRYTNSNSVSDGSGTLAFPQSNFPVLSSAPSVSWLGDFGGSYHIWPNDLGSGKFAVLCGGRAANSSAGFFQDVILSGPGVGGTLGASSCNMQGIGWNDRRNMLRVQATGFWAGVNIVGGQAGLYEVTCSACYYGWYWDNPQTANFGDILFSHCYGQLCNKAGIGVHENAAILTSVFIKCFTGASPYGIFKETGGSTNEVMHECKRLNCQSENCGNAFIGDGLTTPVAVIYNSDFENEEFEWGPAFNIAAQPQRAIIDVYEILGLTIRMPYEPGLWTPGTASLFKAAYYGSGFKIIGDVETLLANCVTASLPFISSGDYAPNGNIELEHGGNGYASPWKGSIWPTNGTMPVGMVAITDALTGVQQSAGNTADTVIGIVMFEGAWAAIAHSGVVNVNVTGSISGSPFMRSAASGHCVAASGSNDTTSKIIGTAAGAISAGQLLVRLAGLI